MTRRKSAPAVPEARETASDARRPNRSKQALERPPDAIRPRFRTADELIKESEWQRTVVALFQAHGWRCWHNTVAWRSDPGWVDLVVVHPDRGIAFLELKAQRGVVSASQESWHDALRAAGQRVYVLRPSDVLVAQALARGTGHVTGASETRD